MVSLGTHARPLKPERLRVVWPFVGEKSRGSQQENLEEERDAERNVRAMIIIIMIAQAWRCGDVFLLEMGSRRGGCRVPRCRRVRVGTSSSSKCGDVGRVDLATIGERRWPHQHACPWLFVGRGATLILPVQGVLRLYPASRMRIALRPKS